jgi:hypothetical protein
MTGGFLADGYSKRTVTIWIEFFEMAVMVLAIAGLEVRGPIAAASQSRQARILGKTSKPPTKSVDFGLTARCG